MLKICVHAYIEALAPILLSAVAFHARLHLNKFNEFHVIDKADLKYILRDGLIVYQASQRYFRWLHKGTLTEGEDSASLRWVVLCARNLEFQYEKELI
jgi:hypothetical protein